MMSPARAPRMAWARGERKEIRPLEASASSTPTMRKVCWRPLRVMVTVEPKVTGAYADDQSFRVQCAELCGLDHSVMSFPIRVVEKPEFDQWLASLKTGAK